jgi:hypothetical protein
MSLTLPDGGNFGDTTPIFREQGSHLGVRFFLAN